MKKREMEREVLSANEMSQHTGESRTPQGQTHRQNAITDREGGHSPSFSAIGLGKFRGSPPSTVFQVAKFVPLGLSHSFNSGGGVLPCSV